MIGTCRRWRASGRSNYNMARDYDPDIGRYVESDPLGIKPGVNTYAYVRNNSESYNDPTGLQAASTWGCDGMGHYVPFVVDKNPCTAASTPRERAEPSYFGKFQTNGACGPSGSRRSKRLSRNRSRKPNVGDRNSMWHSCAKRWR
jgi:RHS repeat-associated protein